MNEGEILQALTEVNDKQNKIIDTLVDDLIALEKRVEILEKRKYVIPGACR